MISRVFLENNVTIVNGRSISSGGTSKARKFDERKAADCGNIKKIAINSMFFDVNVSVSKSSKVEAHFYGEADMDGEIEFDVQVVDHELRITLDFTGNYFNGNPKLDVTIPQRTFQVISARSLSANITLNEGVSTNYLKVIVQTGNLETRATANNVSISTSSGNVELCIDATQNINVEIFTMSGDVSAEFNNIGHMNLATKSMTSGDVRNLHKESSGYTADVDISTMSGNITIR